VVTRARPGAPIIYGKDAASYFLRCRQNPSPSAALWRRLPICHVRSFPLLSRHFIICLPRHHKPHDSSTDGYELWREIYLHPAVCPPPPLHISCHVTLRLREHTQGREERLGGAHVVHSLLRNNSGWYKGCSIAVSISDLYYKADILIY